MKKIVAFVFAFTVLTAVGITPISARTVWAGTCVCSSDGDCTGGTSTAATRADCQCADSPDINNACIVSFTASSAPTVAAPVGLNNAGVLFKEAGTKAGFPEGAVPPEVVIGQLIRALIVLMGVIFGVLMVYAGFLWMTARGNDEYVKKAKNILESATIGIIIVVAAYAITTFVVDKVISSSFQQATSGTCTPACTASQTCVNGTCR